MATKEDILEQLVEEYLLHQGYFVRHNIKFLPDPKHPDFVKNQDSNHSDIDVIGLHPKKRGVDRVVVVSCKSWQSGFNPKNEIRKIEEGKTSAGRDAWRRFRELAIPKWSAAFLDTVEAETGSRRFVYTLAVTRLHGDKSVWETHQRFRDALEDNPIRLLTFREMVTAIDQSLAMKKNMLAGTEVGRMLQLFRAADFGLCLGS